MKYLVGIDLGTSGVKCLAMDEAGKVIKSVVCEYPLYTPKPAWSEQDPADWWNGTRKALRKMLKGLYAGRICAVGLSGQMHGLVALGENNAVIRRAILWNDQRTGAECEEIIAAAGGMNGILSYTNNTMLTGYTGGKLLWFKKYEPGNYARMKKLVMPKDYIRFYLTGILATDVSDASGTGLFDVKNRKWADELIGKLGFSPDLFPSVYESDRITGYVTKRAEEETGLPAGTPVYGGGGDAVIQNAGMGIVREGTLGVVMGTSGVVGTSMNRFAGNAGGKLQVFCNNAADKWIALGGQLSCAGSMEWFKNVFYSDSGNPFAQINRDAEMSPIGAGGVRFLPYLTGERCPYPDPDARGVFYGMSLLTKRGDLARAVMEGVAFGLRQIYDLIREANPSLQFSEAILSGGGAKSALWKQIVADIFDLPFKILAGAAEGGAFGGAIVAGVGERIWKSLDDVDVYEEKEVVDPIPENVREYKKYFKIHAKLYSDLKDTFKISHHIYSDNE